MTSAPTHHKSRARRRKDQRLAARHQAIAHMVLHGWVPLLGEKEGTARPAAGIWNPERGLVATWFAAGGYGTIQNASPAGLRAQGLKECEWDALMQGRFFALRDKLLRRGWLDL